MYAILLWVNHNFIAQPTRYKTIVLNYQWALVLLVLFAALLKDLGFCFSSRCLLAFACAGCGRL